MRKLSWQSNSWIMREAANALTEAQAHMSQAEPDFSGGVDRLLRVNRAQSWQIAELQGAVLALAELLVELGMASEQAVSAKLRKALEAVNRPKRSAQARVEMVICDRCGREVSIYDTSPSPFGEVCQLCFGSPALGG